MRKGALVKHIKLFRSRQGFTLVEMLVVMAVFLVIIMIAAQTFQTIVSLASKYSKSEESNIEGIIGLEVMRHDIEQMGFGLFWGYLPGVASIAYSESSVANAATNDAPNVPRAFVALNNSASFSSDLIGIKGTTVGRTKASQRWTYVPFNNFSGSLGSESRPVAWRSNNLKSSPNADRVIAIRSNFNDADDDHLLLDSAGSFWFSFSTTGSIVDDFLPTKDQQISMVYGIDSYDPSSTPRMPFNRSDYFISTTTDSVPPFCAPLTGILYKATVNHADGGYMHIPIMDCIADMQVVLGWDGSEGGKANSVSGFSDVAGTNTSGVSASDVQSWLVDPKGVREHLKIVKIYILAQEGKRDPGFTYPLASLVVGDATNGETSMTSTYVFSAAQRNYRWKLYRLVVRPKNLVSNQQ